MDEVSNHAISLYFALNKKLFTLADALRSGDWGYSSVVPLHRIAGSTLGLAGFGRIPQSVAKKMKGFDVHILAYDPFCSAEKMSEMGVEKVELSQLLEESDSISIHCPSTPETHHMFNSDAFRAMKKTAFLINTARAGLDVFEREPISKDSPLLHMPNVIATPHSAWYTEESIKALQRSVGEEVVRVLGGNPPLHPCNIAALKKYGF